MTDRDRLEFDPEAEAIYCSFDGLRLEKSGHMGTEFLMCPRHGEFTMAPTVTREPLKVMGGPPSFRMISNPSPDAGKWFLVGDRTTIMQWKTCRAVSDRHKDGSEYDPRETRVL